MTAIDPDAIESQMHLEAMLYLLDDSALDRDAFEARLSNDFQLGEILAKAVGTFHNLRSSDLERLAVWPTSMSYRGFDFQNPRRERGIADGPSPPAAAPIKNSFRTGLFVPTVAASLFFACFLGWQAFLMTQTGKINSQLSSLNNVVLAWGDLQSEREDLSLTQESSDSEFAPALSLADSFVESEVPDWLVLAATKALDENDSGDGKVFFQ